MSTPSALQDAALVLIDVQNTYRRGELQLENVEPAVVEAQRLLALGVQKLVLAGFMTHMCITATSHGAVNRGYTPTVVASTTATRALDAGHGRTVPAAQVHESALAAIRDLGVTIVDRVDDLSA